MKTTTINRLAAIAVACCAIGGVLEGRADSPCIPEAPAGEKVLDRARCIEEIKNDLIATEGIPTNAIVSIQDGLRYLNELSSRSGCSCKTIGSSGFYGISKEPSRGDIAVDVIAMAFTNKTETAFINGKDGNQYEDVSGGLVFAFRYEHDGRVELIMEKHCYRAIPSFARLEVGGVPQYDYSGVLPFEHDNLSQMLRIRLEHVVQEMVNGKRSYEASAAAIVELPYEMGAEDPCQNGDVRIRLVKTSLKDNTEGLHEKSVKSTTRIVTLPIKYVELEPEDRTLFRPERATRETDVLIKTVNCKFGEDYYLKPEPTVLEEGPYWKRINFR